MKKLKRRKNSNNDKKLLLLMGKRYRQNKSPRPTPKEAYAIGRQLLGLPPLKKKRKIKRRKSSE
jgi:hypothetical protein